MGTTTSASTKSTDKTLDVAIMIIVVFVFVVFFAWMAHSLIATKFEKTPEAIGAVNFTITCPPGQCATSISSGIKTCLPDITASMTIDPAVSVCNSRYLCDNPLTPYARLYDGSTNSSGVCDDGVECPCLRIPYCPDYVVSLFTSTNGNPFQEAEGQRILFPQQSLYVGATGPNLNPPFPLSDPTQFCFASSQWLTLSNPGCPMFSGEMTPDQVIYCMGGAKGCSELNSNPCLQGTLALISDDPETVTKKTASNGLYGCVRGDPCPCGQMAIFDKNFGQVVCRHLS